MGARSDKDAVQTQLNNPCFGKIESKTNKTNQDELKMMMIQLAEENKINDKLYTSIKQSIRGTQEEINTLFVEWLKFEASNKKYPENIRSYFELYIGMIYYERFGIASFADENERIAYEWIVKSSERNNTYAQSYHGLILLNGLIVPQDLNKSFDIFQKVRNKVTHMVI